jgi:hypothetical protein
LIRVSKRPEDVEMVVELLAEQLGWWRQSLALYCSGLAAFTGRTEPSVGEVSGGLSDGMKTC